MEVASTSETTVNFHQTIWRNTPEDNHLQCVIYSFVIYLKSLWTQRLYSVEWMYREGCGRKRAWLDLRYYPSICLERLMKITEKLNRMADPRHEIWKRNLSNTKQTCSNVIKRASRNCSPTVTQTHSWDVSLFTSEDIYLPTFSLNLYLKTEMINGNQADQFGKKLRALSFCLPWTVAASADLIAGCRSILTHSLMSDNLQIRAVTGSVLSRDLKRDLIRTCVA
jgi:hypothetical protein